jgi:hypothetical protein
VISAEEDFLADQEAAGREVAVPEEGQEEVVRRAEDAGDLAEAVAGRAAVQVVAVDEEAAEEGDWGGRTRIASD